MGSSAGLSCTLREVVCGRFATKRASLEAIKVAIDQQQDSAQVLSFCRGLEQANQFLSIILGKTA